MAYEISDKSGTGYGLGNRQTFAYASNNISGDVNNPADKTPNWGSQASRSLYSAHANQSDDCIKYRSLADSRLWHGVPQLTDKQMEMFEAAYTGHTFIFMTHAPKFMTTGIYYNTNLHYQMKNLKAVIEKASTGFSGATNITANFADQDDGNGRKVSHVTSVTKEQNDITLRLHEFAALPVKNALESWLTGIYDYKSQHGHYFGNLGIPGGWCLANHSAGILVVQVDPSWQVIQDAVYYYNMVPTEVPFEHFEWTKGEQTIVDDYSINFKCNEERSPMITYAAERYMNNRVLSMVATSVYNSRQFVVSDFMDGTTSFEIDSFNSYLTNDEYFDSEQYNIKINNHTTGTDSAVQKYSENVTGAELGIDRYVPNTSKTKIVQPVPNMYNTDSLDTSETTKPWKYTAPTAK